MKNLEQFSNRPQEFETYLKDEKGIDISGKTSTAKIVLIIVGIMFAGLGLLYCICMTDTETDKTIANTGNSLHFPFIFYQFRETLREFPIVCSVMIIN